jgi:hypothetical protein
MAIKQHDVRPFVESKARRCEDTNDLLLLASIHVLLICMVFVTCIRLCRPYGIE